MPKRWWPAAVFVFLGTSACGPPAQVSYYTAPTAPAETQQLPAPAAPAPVYPCRGTAFTLDHLKKHCRVEKANLTPPPGALAITADPLTAKTGERASTTVSMRNVTGKPLELSVRPYAIFTPSVLRDDERVDETLEQPLLAQLIGCVVGLQDCRPMRIVLEPNGVLSAKVRIPTRVTRYVEPETQGALRSMKATDGGPIAPGDYRAVIELPWSDKTGEHSRKARTVELPLRLTP
jgi:hypothetical protein